MKTIIYSIILSLSFCFPSLAQEYEKDDDQYIQVFLGADTILMDNSFEFKVVINNLRGDFDPPQFEDFDIVGGPNMSSNMRFINGKLSSQKTFTYILKPRKPGEFFIEEAFLILEAETIQSEAIPVFVLDNPENIVKDYRIKGSDGAIRITPFKLDEKNSKEKKKPKRKLKKI